jgi:hypothetical protein
MWALIGVPIAVAIIMFFLIPVLERPREKFLSWIGLEPKTKTKKQEEEQKHKRAVLKRSWENNQGILRRLKGPLQELTSIISFQDTYTPAKCVKLLRSIGAEAERIERSEFQSIREKLLKFSKKRDELSQTTPSGELMNIINGKYDRLGPRDLLNEIDATLRDTPAPPFAEEDPKS